MGETYAGAGVDIDAGDDAVERIKPLVKSTHRPEVLGGLGGFGGAFDVSSLGLTEPVLVSGTDGVGTKAVVARAARRFDTIGIDLVAMCVDDLVCQGAAPLFFLDYISIGKVDPDIIEALVTGVAEGCRQAGCALIGGETAEHRGVMGDDEFDLVGFAVGAVERAKLLTGESASVGDVVIGLPSPNLRSNGFTLARRLFFDVAERSLDDPAWDSADVSVADVLLDPSVIYTPAVLAVLGVHEVHGIAHITGGGIVGNVGRSLSDSVDARIDGGSWEPPRVFTELQRIGNVADDEMLRVFNNGIGMTIVVPAAEAPGVIATLDAHGHHAVTVGEIVAGTGAVEVA